MRILIIGAGAVGAVLARALEKNKGHDVAYLVREHKPARVKLLDVRTGELHVRERPQAFTASDTLYAFDLAILAVRGDQLDGALDAAAKVPGAPKLAVAAAGFDAIDRVRARFPG